MACFGLVLPIQGRGMGLDQLLEELVEEVLEAERAGFEAVFLPEFHQAHGGALVSPLLVLAWLGARTTRIRLGTLVLAAPLHDPVRLAEDALMLDHATRGRVIVGMGSAHMPPDFALFGRPRAERQAIFDELLDVLDACWSNQPFEHEGRYFTARGHVTPAPYSDPRPEVWIGAHGPRGLRRAGERADCWIADPQRDVDAIARLAETYRQAAREAGRTPRVALFREAWVADSREECEELWAPHAMKVHRLYFNVGVYRKQFEPWVDEIRTREDFTLDRIAPGRFLYGTPEEVRATARDWFARTGAEHIAVRMRHPTGPSHEETMAAIARFGRDVIAPLKAELAGAGQA
jgi:alkanesulfonate monooxygenase SsuD/methylene tetrahydromethanopterin reductase-like flavin-dependent oxidoreductase (luciferase family)